MREHPDPEVVNHVQMLANVWLPGKDFQWLLNTYITHTNSLIAFGKYRCPCLVG